jgi:hypothetical protein
VYLDLVRSWAIAVLLACVGCVNDDLVRCGDQFCPAGDICTETQHVCASNDELAACTNLEEAAPCDVKHDGMFVRAGFCTDGACHTPVCGNDKTEYGEACDDNNTVDDGICSHDCLSDYRCGNDIIDALVTDTLAGEQCDSGIVGLSGDGCTSGCRAEQDLWIDTSPAQLTKRYGARMAYDAAHHQIVLFGGRETTGASDETWIFQDNAWERVAVTTFPEARYNHAMGYDPTYGVVLFGGFNGSTYFNDTWFWDGSKWAKQDIKGTPP